MAKISHLVTIKQNSRIKGWENNFLQKLLQFTKKKIEKKILIVVVVCLFIVVGVELSSLSLVLVLSLLVLVFYSLVLCCQVKMG